MSLVFLENPMLQLLIDSSGSIESDTVIFSFLKVLLKRVVSKPIEV